MQMNAMSTAEECLEQAEKCLLEGLVDQAAVMVQMAQVRAYKERTNIIGEVTGWQAGGTLDVYFQWIREALLSGNTVAAEQIAHLEKLLEDEGS